jgi:thermitase
MKKRLLITLAIVALLVSVTSGLAMAQAPDKGQGHAPDQILVKFKPGTPERGKTDVHQRHGGRVVDTIPAIDVQVVRIPENKVGEKVRAYKAEASVEFAEPDYIAEAILTPNDPYFGKQWGMTKIQAPEAWDITLGSAAVKIAVLDTGIDQNHEDLVRKIVANKNFTRSSTVDDKYGHGTHVAGIAAATTNNAKGIAGVGFNSSLMNGKVLGDTGTGYYSWIASGIIWAADNGAKVINMSLGGTSGSSTLESAVNYAWGKGVVLVAAAGNSDTDAPLYPAYYTNCIAVAATDKNDAKASFSNYGDWVDIAAPGVDIFSTMPNHKNRIGILNYGSLSGTSMSTPHVAGVAALVFAQYPQWSNSDVRTRIETSADPTTGFTTTVGRVNAWKAVR